MFQVPCHCFKRLQLFCPRIHRTLTVDKKISMRFWKHSWKDVIILAKRCGKYQRHFCDPYARGGGGGGEGAGGERHLLLWLASCSWPPCAPPSCPRPAPPHNPLGMAPPQVGSPQVHSSWKYDSHQAEKEKWQTGAAEARIVPSTQADHLGRYRVLCTLCSSNYLILSSLSISNIFTFPFTWQPAWQSFLSLSKILTKARGSLAIQFFIRRTRGKRSLAASKEDQAASKSWKLHPFSCSARPSLVIPDNEPHSDNMSCFWECQFYVDRYTEWLFFYCSALNSASPLRKSQNCPSQKTTKIKTSKSTRSFELFLP